jgi:tetratricopeptide (TPR) repeat protein
MSPGSTWGPVSGAPFDTWAAAAQLLACACLLATSLDLARDDRGRRGLLVLCAAMGGAVLGVAVVHEAMGQNLLYGRYSPSGVPRLVTPFINANHGAAALALGALASLGLSLDARAVKARLGWVGLAALLAAAVFPCNSFGGLGGLVVGLAVLSTLAWRGSATLRGGVVETVVGPVPVLPVAALVAALGVVVASALGLDPFSTWREATGAMSRKLLLMAEATAPLGQHWLVGMGRGAFAQVFPRHMTLGLFETLVGPENVLALLALEWGLPVAALYAGAWAVVTVRGLARTREALPAAGLAAVVAVATHNLVDFNLETLGIALPFTVMLGVGLAAEPPPHRRQDARRSTGWAAGLALAALPACVVPPVLLLRHDVRVSRAAALAVPLPERSAALHHHLRGHPTDYLAALSLARVVRAVDPEALRESLAWTNRALFLRPNFAESHLDAARLLWRLGQRSQALLEYGLALRCPPTSKHHVLEELIRVGATPAELLDVFGTRDLDVCDRLNPLPGAAWSCLARVAEENGTDPVVVVAVGERHLARGRRDQAEELARQALQVDPRDGPATSLLVRVLLARGQTAEADRVLDGAGSLLTSVPLERLRLRRALDRGDLDAAKGFATRLGEALERDKLSVLEALLAEANVEERRGNVIRALDVYQAAARANPSSAEAVLNAARLAVGMGRTELALRVLQEAYEKAGNTAYLQRIRELVGK